MNALMKEVGMLHPEISAFLDMVDDGRRTGRPALHELPVEQARQDFEASSESLKAGAPSMPVEALLIPAREGRQLPVRLYRPVGAGDGAILYFHGGGYTVGSLDSHDGLCRLLAQHCACAVISVGYRLAPEAPFPAANRDARDAWNWLLGSAASLSLNPRRLAVGGDSAGATLATVLCAELAGEGAEQPCAQLLFYPAADAGARSESQELFAEGYLLETASLDWFYQQYVPNVAQRSDWRCSPVHAGAALQGSAPALLFAAQFDPLLDEGLAYAHALVEQGVEVEAERCCGMTHDFLRMGNLVPEVEGYFRRVAEFLAARW
ncbi:alpha/beta hydrolase [Pseudomonas nicosulfuronedens]|uniref:Alpha/beta hydrolase n=1 Tax=Pseudomonas nicosulfuronedens TaxID=2571105 RepID=A0A5R9R920_9PSED|nr:alpha/beta hydrolase [Pseudomonas nicosulfuronedens]MDH1010960.1 alpha/beta hydrolase [Pseudomonas nicosulfuronedens]MDH1979483.1 alpha/beta hydrolase [Pseudomonas nicosulfuronedens]MDH2026730.1 alpha/beta hydrolase [Pseudomonas nicosulfuronedens]TLX79437.1 alpha/beta hydrolase [Pseudomonas nicosulfuronedens]